MTESDLFAKRILRPISYGQKLMYCIGILAPLSGIISLTLLYEQYSHSGHGVEIWLFNVGYYPHFFIYPIALVPLGCMLNHRILCSIRSMILTRPNNGSLLGRKSKIRRNTVRFWISSTFLLFSVLIVVYLQTYKDNVPAIWEISGDYVIWNDHPKDKCSLLTFIREIKNTNSRSYDGKKIECLNRMDLELFKSNNGTSSKNLLLIALPNIITLLFFTLSILILFSTLFWQKTTKKFDKFHLHRANLYCIVNILLSIILLYLLYNYNAEKVIIDGMRFDPAVGLLFVVLTPGILVAGLFLLGKTANSGNSIVLEFVVVAISIFWFFSKISAGIESLDYAFGKKLEAEYLFLGISIFVFISMSIYVVILSEMPNSQYRYERNRK